MRKVPHVRAWKSRDYTARYSKDYPSTQGTSSRALIHHNWRSIGSIKVTRKSKIRCQQSVTTYCPSGMCTIKAFNC